MAIVFAGLVAACTPPQAAPRSFFEFMEDGIARDGVLARCNQDRDATLSDVECANARRAAAAVALGQDRARAGELESESERKLRTVRQREAVASAAQQDAIVTARADAAAAGSAPVFGAPLGSVLPSITESSLFDVYADGSTPLSRPALEAVAVDAPTNDIEIAAPQLALEGVAIIPRPFRRDDEAVPQ
jgi:hypothetical protein